MRRREGLVLFVAGLAGAATMAVELAAVRVLAPWFGTSTAVWTNVIGVVLLALALGYLLGARFSRARHPERPLGLVLCAAAVLAAVVPVASGPLARLFLPAGLTLEQAGTLLPLASLATAVCLFLPSATLLGCVAPLCAEILARDARRSAGPAGGWVLCASTLGSLAGTFSTTYLLVPHLGTTRSFLLAAAVLAVLGALVLVLLAPGGRARLLSLLALLVPLGLQARAARTPALPEGALLLAARESTLQAVRVVERGAGAERTRTLQVNESFDSYQSVWCPTKGFLPGNYYYDFFAFPLWWSRDLARWRVGVVGLGGGTVWRVLDGARPAGVELELEGAEIDPVLVDLARAWLDLPEDDPRCRAWAGLDGRALVAARPDAFELLVLDAYANQTEIPPHLSSLEFFRAARASLVRGGWVAANVGGFGFDDPVVSAVAGTLATAFERRVLALRVPFTRNVVLFARHEAEPPDPRSPDWSTHDERVERLLGPVALDVAHRWFAPLSRAPLTDDLNPIQELQRASIEHIAREARP